jgi:hypothetical protein
MFDYHDRAYPFQIIYETGEKYGFLSMGGVWNIRGKY